jgi:hypothetical protein
MGVANTPPPAGSRIFTRPARGSARQPSGSPGPPGGEAAPVRKIPRHSPIARRLPAAGTPIVSLAKPSRDGRRHPPRAPRQERTPCPRISAPILAPAGGAARFRVAPATHRFRRIEAPVELRDRTAELLHLGLTIVRLVRLTNKAASAYRIFEDEPPSVSVSISRRTAAACMLDLVEGAVSLKKTIGVRGAHPRGLEGAALPVFVGTRRRELLAARNVARRTSSKANARGSRATRRGCRPRHGPFRRTEARPPARHRRPRSVSRACNRPRPANEAAPRRTGVPAPCAHPSVTFLRRPVSCR